MTSLVIAGVALAAVVGWTAWEAAMAARLRRSTALGREREAAVTGALRLVVLGQLAIISLCTGAALAAGVPLWRGSASLAPVASVLAATVVGGAALVATIAAIGWLARRGLLPGRRWALAATVLTAVAAEVAWRGLALGALSTAGVPLTVSVALAAVAGGLTQAWRSVPGSRVTAATWSTVLGFLLGLVAVTIGSVAATAAVHVAVAVAGYARSLGQQAPTSASTAGAVDLTVAASAPAPDCGTCAHAATPTGARPAGVTAGGEPAAAGARAARPAETARPETARPETARPETARPETVDPEGEACAACPRPPVRL